MSLRVPAPVYNIPLQPAPAGRPPSQPPLQPPPPPSHASPAIPSTMPPQRRGVPPMIPNPSQPPPQMTAQQQAAQHHAMQQEREIAKRRALKPTDKNLPDGVDTLVPTAQSYHDLREMERRYDAAIMRKRLDIQDAVNRSVKNARTVRIFVSNTAKDQPWQVSDRPLDENAFDFDTGQIPMFRVKIEGKLLDEEEEGKSELDPDADLELEGEKRVNKLVPTTPKRKFSDFFKSIIIELDRPKDLHPDGNTIEWRKFVPNTQPATAALGQEGPKEFDGFEFERKGDENINCTIKLIRDDNPDRFKLSPPLANLLDTKEDTRAGLVMKIWEYVREHNLQDPEDRRQVICNQPMREVFGTDKLWFPRVVEMTLSHISPLDPITINYTIRTDVSSYFSPTVYDVTVYMDDPIRAKMHSVMASPKYAESLREIQAMDDHIAVLVQALDRSKAKHDFWEAFGADPAGFIGRWISSQKRDLDMICGEGASASVEEDERRKAMWRDRMAENVYLLLARQGR